MEEKNKGGRPRLSKLKQPFVKPGTNEVQRIRMGVGAYVQRYTKCGPRCSSCDPQHEHFDERRPGHGPYWYFEAKHKGKTVRRYVGKTLKVIERDKTGGSVVVQDGFIPSDDDALGLQAAEVEELVQ